MFGLSRWVGYKSLSAVSATVRKASWRSLWEISHLWVRTYHIQLSNSMETLKKLATAVSKAHMALLTVAVPLHWNTSVESTR